MSGRIADIAVTDAQPIACASSAPSSTPPRRRAACGSPRTPASRSTPIFDSVRTGSIGAVAVAPSNSDIVWVGTGEVEQHAQLVVGHRRLQVHRRRQDVVGRDAPEVAAHRPHRHRSARPERRLRRRDRTALGVGRRARTLQDDRRRQDVDEHEGDQQVHRLQRARDGSVEPRRALRGALEQRERREYGFLPAGPESGIFKTTDGAKTWTQARAGPARGRPRPHRA